MNKKAKNVYILASLWFLLCVIFLNWGYYSLVTVLQIPDWREVSSLLPILYFSFLISTIVWFVFACLFLIFSYGTLKGKSWVWTTGIIISTIFIVVFVLMLASFMATALLFLDWFSVYGLTTVVISLLIDLGILYFLTRPSIKIYFEVPTSEQ